MEGVEFFDCTQQEGGFVNKTTPEELKMALVMKGELCEFRYCRSLSLN